MQQLLLLLLAVFCDVSVPVYLVLCASIFGLAPLYLRPLWHYTNAVIIIIIITTPCTILTINK